MSGRDGAADRFQRILALLPLAARSGGITFDELTDQTGASRADIIRDLQDVVDRDTYHPAGGADIPIAIETDRVRVWTTPGEFDRPVRLTLREAAALELGLRAIAMERAGDGSVIASARTSIAAKHSPAGDRPHADRHSARTDSTTRLSQRLTAALAWAAPDPIASTVVLQPDGLGDDPIRARMVQAARERRRVRVSYVKPGAEPEPRTIDPYAVAFAAGHGYTIAHCHARDDVRVFRIDRMLEVELLDEDFDVPHDFDPLAFAVDGSVFDADDAVDVDVRIRGELARWLARVRGVSAGDAGDALLRLRVADPGWIVRRVLGYGADAEITTPSEFRAQMRRAALRAAET